MPVTQYTDNFAKLQTLLATLTFGSKRTLQLFGGGHVAYAANSYSTILKFRIACVEYQKQR